MRIPLSESFLRGRAAHLHGKRAEISRRLRSDRDMPERHRRYKIDVLLPAIDRAFRRLRNGAYGTCGVCGQSIPARRLELLPEAERCVQCAGGAP